MTSLNTKLIDEFFVGATITGNLSESSMWKYRASIRKFLKVVGNKFIGDLDYHDFDVFILRMRTAGATGARIRNVISAMKSLLGYLQRERLIASNLDLEKIRKPKLERKAVNYLTEDEITLLFKAVRKDIEAGIMIRKVRMMALLLILLQTAARLGETLSIKIRDIDKVNMEIPIIGKGKKPRCLYISEDTVFWIDKYLSLRSDNNEYLFVSLNGKSKWKQTDVGRSFRRYRKLSGITKPFVLHTLRHTAATQLALKGVPMNEIQKILGHSHLETTLKYYIGAVESDLAKKVIRDEHYRYIPKEIVGDI